MNISQVRAMELEERMSDFALSCINLSREYSTNMENKIILNQLVRSSASIGANYAEANNAGSRADFRNKLYLSKKEASETRYWLKLLGRANISISTIKLVDECTELILILQKSINTLKNAK